MLVCCWFVCCMACFMVWFVCCVVWVSSVMLSRMGFRLVAMENSVCGL